MNIQVTNNADGTVTLGSVGNTVAVTVTPVVVPVPVLFSDNFASGDLSHVENGIMWAGANQVPNGGSNADPYGSSVAVIPMPAGIPAPPSGPSANALSFIFGNANPSTMAWAEQDMYLGGIKPSLTIAWDWFVPANYVNRDLNGGNNKLCSMYQTGANVWNLTICTVPSTPGSGFFVATSNNGVDNPNVNNVDPNFIQPSDLGAWMRFSLGYVTQPDGTTVVTMTKNGAVVYTGTLPMQATSLLPGANNLYLMGWADSGFAVPTQFLITNVSVT